MIKVPGYERAEWAEADDTGGAMRTAWRKKKEIVLDVRMTYHWQAVQWGDQYLEVIIKSPNAEEE
jgi:3D (Asp-Asp-Asp) domain-containing protein